MVDVSFLQEDPTLAAMKRACEAVKAKEPARDYLGASQIGGSCERAIWYGYNNAPQKPMDWRGCFNVEDGHRTEQLIIDRLLMVKGITITHRQEEYVYKTFFKGHPEGIITGLLQAPNTPHILEVKTCSEKVFNNFKKCIDDYGEKNALQKWNQTYHGQAIILMHGFKVARHYIVVALAGGRDVASCRTEADNTFAKALLDKAERIANTTSPPVRVCGNKDFWLAKFCNHCDHCFEDSQ